MAQTSTYRLRPFVMYFNGRNRHLLLLLLLVVVVVVVPGYLASIMI